MGGISTCCARQHNDEPSRRKTSTPSKKGRHGRTLSATFNMTVIEDAGRKHSLVNVNSANEEELMTLPGISRNIAKSIIDYRTHIGGFRCVEDVALVSGIGAEKLSSIRSDVYVSSPSIGDISDKSLIKTEAASESSTDDTLLVCVNSANIFSLLRVRGIGMGIAKNIVAYRDSHGPFDSLDDLLKVKGIGNSNLDFMRPYLVLTEVATNGNLHNSCHLNGNSSHAKINMSSRENSRHGLSSSLEDVLRILGPMAKIPIRPKVEPVPLTYKNKSMFRLASWNLKRFSSEKAKNPGVKDAVCMTILENGFGILCVQELSDVHALKEICDELNSPTLPNGKKWAGRRGRWVYDVSKPTGKMFQISDDFIFQSTEYHGFLYDVSQNISLQSSCVLEKASHKNRPFSRMPYIGVFSINSKFDCVVVSVHLKATGLTGEDQHRTEAEAETVHDLLQGVKNFYKSERDIIFLGDFNLSPDSKVFDNLKTDGYIPCIPATTYTNISSNNKSGSANYDNIWISGQTRKVFTGRAGVVREGLSNAWIPNGWTWGGVVSDHCPVYAQFYSNSDLDKEDINAGDIKFVLGSSNVV